MNRDPELVLLTDLCRHLAQLGLSVGLGDARPEVVIYNPVPLSITVDESGKRFVWRDGQHAHPAADPAGAARLILSTVRPCDLEGEDCHGPA
jgi:hypothetical protein